MPFLYQRGVGKNANLELEFPLNAFKTLVGKEAALPPALFPENRS